MRRTACLSLLAFSSCVIDEVDLEGKTCPCDAPYVCNEASQRCTRDTDRYAREVMVDGPAAYYRFEETMGSRAEDSSGNDRDGQYFGTVELGAEGAVVGGRAVSLQAGDYLLIGDEFDFADHSPFTYEIWIRLSEQLASDVSIVEKLATDGSFQGYVITINDSTPPYSIALERWNADLPGRPWALDVLPVAEYHHIVVTYAAESGSIYFDGLQVVSDVSHAAMTDTMVSLRVAGGDFIGEIDELAIYDRALTGERIEAHFEAR